MLNVRENIYLLLLATGLYQRTSLCSRFKKNDHLVNTLNARLESLLSNDVNCTSPNLETTGEKETGFTGFPSAKL